MSTVQSAHATALTLTAPHAQHAGRGFAGLLRGEMRKILHLRIAWVLFAVITLIVAALQLTLATGPNTRSQTQGGSLAAFANVLSGDVAIVRILSGIFLLIVSAHVIGLEYQYGTIRILLGRGVGRLRLLAAKALALALVGLSLVAVELAIEVVCSWVIVSKQARIPSGASVQLGGFGAEARDLLFYLALNTFVTLLLGIAASVVGHSLAFGLAVGLSWFAVDNLLSIPLAILARLTHASFWRDLSGILLGPTLNRLPDSIMPAYTVTIHSAEGTQTMTQHVSGFGPPALVTVPGDHALLVIGIYAAIFVVTAILFTWRREVLE